MAAVAPMGPIAVAAAAAGPGSARGATGLAGAVTPAATVLGADRFRALPRRGGSPERREPAAAAGGAEPPSTPAARRPGAAASEGETGARPSPPGGASGTDAAGEPRGGLLALSLRLRGAQLQQSLRQAGEEKEQEKARPGGEIGLAFSARCKAFGAHLERSAAVAAGSAAGAGTAQSSSAGLVSFSQRGRALGEALEKRARAGHQRSWPALGGPAPTEDTTSQPGTGFRPGRLAQWMELNVQNAPPTRTGRDARALPGGLQDAYVRAVRHYLTEASLAAQQDAEMNAEERPVAPSAGTAFTGSLLVAVADAHEGPEGLLIGAAVLQAWMSDNPAMDSSVRLLLHRRHSIFHQRGEAWFPRPGMRLRVQNFNVVAPGAGGRGPLLLPLELAEDGVVW